MQIPLEYAFNNVDPPQGIEVLIRKEAEQLQRFHSGMTSCRVHVSVPHKRQRKGNLFEVTVEVGLPGADLVVHHREGNAPEHEHVAVAVRDAFSAMARKLNRRKQISGGDVKVHEGPLQGRIAEIDHDRGFGQIIATDHRLIYFHKNSVVDGSFENLRPRDTVELVVQTDESEIGPQASTMRPIGSLQYDPG